jgi:hypothetical protein
MIRHYVSPKGAVIFRSPHNAAGCVLVSFTVTASRCSVRA